MIHEQRRNDGITPTYVGETLAEIFDVSVAQELSLRT